VQIVKVIEDDFLNFPNEHSLTLFSGGCNYACSHCKGYNYEYVTDKTNNLGDFTEVFNKYFNEIYSAVVFLGGEPLIHDIVPYLKHCKKLGLKTKVFTNGYFPDKLRVILEQGLVDSVSVDYKIFHLADPHSIKSILGEHISVGEFKTNFLSCLKLIETYKSNVCFEVRTTMCAENLFFLEEMKNYITCRGLDNIYIVQEDIRTKIFREDN